MPRISGIDIPMNKKIWVGLTYVYGIGRDTSRKLLDKASIDPNLRAKDLSDEQVSKITSLIEEEKLKVEGALRREINENISRLKEINCYRGLRHKKGLPTRGQRTSSNARTRKGPRKTVAGKKLAAKK